MNEENKTYLFLPLIILITFHLIQVQAIQAQANSNTTQLCANYPIHAKTELGLLPKNASLNKVDVNFDKAIDLIATYSGGGSTLYINCDTGLYYRAVQSVAQIEVRATDKDNWMPLFVTWEDERATWIDGQLYRPNLLPFTSKAPVDFLIEHDDHTYVWPFSDCKTLGLHAPQYRFDSNLQEIRNNNGRFNTLYLELTQTKFHIEAETQEEYTFGKLYFTKINKDNALDAILLYEERYGSGREAFGEILLNCGDDSFVASGRIELGWAPLASNPPLQTEKISICGHSFTALVFKQQIRNADISQVPIQLHQYQYDLYLYLYRPVLKDFFQVAALPTSNESVFKPKTKGQCISILKRVKSISTVK
ncbi:MAG: hypothetical protein SVR94_04630 [Pseudomonadota bacterium]|nr:hypothetical protein [Pseudomonadota bacterium]